MHESQLSATNATSNGYTIANPTKSAIKQELTKLLKSRILAMLDGKSLLYLINCLIERAMRYEL